MELIISCFADKIVSSQTCGPKGCRRGTLRYAWSGMKVLGNDLGHLSGLAYSMHRESSCPRP
jgi:hypothetical protein